MVYYVPRIYGFKIEGKRETKFDEGSNDGPLKQIQNLKLTNA